MWSPKSSETIEVRHEKKTLPAMFYLLTIGTKWFLTRHEISPLYRLPSPRLWMFHVKHRVRTMEAARWVLRRRLEEW